ncbi:MAG: peptidyl-tRNA hydrolase [Candidatus Aenigmarchaeota archaeon]|nr:peptidyl-tRNA hydrolase [Candidatus Aenigmarchaeota archaeon]
MWKQVIVIRQDLRMSKGKTAAQVAHASLEAYKKSSLEDQIEWEAWGSKKVVLKIKTLHEIITLQKAAAKARVPNALIKDAGHTEVEPGTVTALGIGPCSEDEIDHITGHLQML